MPFGKIHTQQSSSTSLGFWERMRARASGERMRATASGKTPEAGKVPPKAKQGDSSVITVRDGASTPPAPLTSKFWQLRVDGSNRPPLQSGDRVLYNGQILDVPPPPPDEEPLTDLPKPADACKNTNSKASDKAAVPPADRGARARISTSLSGPSPVPRSRFTPALDTIDEGDESLVVGAEPENASAALVQEEPVESTFEQFMAEHLCVDGEEFSVSSDGKTALPAAGADDVPPPPPLPSPALPETPRAASPVRTPKKRISRREASPVRQQRSGARIERVTHHDAMQTPPATLPASKVTARELMTDRSRAMPVGSLVRFNAPGSQTPLTIEITGWQRGGPTFKAKDASLATLERALNSRARHDEIHSQASSAARTNGDLGHRVMRKGAGPSGLGSLIKASTYDDHSRIAEFQLQLKGCVNERVEFGVQKPSRKAG